MIDPRSIVAYRAAHGLTQQQFADQVGVHMKTVVNWESGRVSPQPAKRALLVEMLGDGSWNLLGAGTAEYTPTPLEERIAGTIRAEAARQMKTQQELASAAGISQSQMSKVMRADRPMTIGMLQAVATALGMDVQVSMLENDFAPALQPVPDWAERRRQKLRDEGEMGYE